MCVKYYPLQMRGQEPVCQQDTPSVRVAGACRAECQRATNAGHNDNASAACLPECHTICAHRRLAAAAVPRHGGLCAHRVVAAASQQLPVPAE